MDFDNYSLFNEAPLDANGPPQKRGLKIVAAGAKPLSKSQKTFNKLTRRIEQLQSDIKADADKLESLLKVYLAEVPGRKRSIAEIRVEIAKALAASTDTIKFGKGQLEQVRTAILLLCDEAFMDIEPDPETETFYDSWSAMSYREEARQQINMIKHEFAEQARAAFGIRMDVNEMGDTPEEFARFARRLRDEFGDTRQKHTGGAAGRRKTKKQLEREELRKREEALTLKSMRAIYLSLAKALHPDTIIDPAEKARKEDLMKKVTVAYADRDLTALLKLEMEWVRSENETLDMLPEDQLKLYIASLKEQVEALEQERSALHMHPRFADVYDFSYYPTKQGIQQIRKTAREYGIVAEDLREILAVISKPESKKKILEFAKAYVSESEAFDPFDEVFMRDGFD